MAENTPEWVEKTQAKIREAFDLFDKDKSDAIVKEEVGTVMRALNCFPNERALVLEIIPEMQDHEPTDFVSHIRCRIDASNLGYISADVMEDFLTTKGTAFRQKELDNFFSVAKDLETGNIYYEDYIALVTKREAEKET